MQVTEGPTGSESRISPRVWIGLVIAAIVIAFIAGNQEDANISFLFVTRSVPLWLALGLAGLGGFLVGMLFGRRRR